MLECAEIRLYGKQSDIFLISNIYPDMFLNLTNNPRKVQTRIGRHIAAWDGKSLRLR